MCRRFFGLLLPCPTSRDRRRHLCGLKKLWLSPMPHVQYFVNLVSAQTGFSLPRQHALVHYSRLIQEFGAPNGLCSSITESRHITAVKRPWRRSNRFNALGQMLLTNQRLDKLGLARVDFVARGMLPTTVSIPARGHNTLHNTIDEDILTEARVEMARRQRK
jgi:hypothetical protein